MYVFIYKQYIFHWTQIYFDWSYRKIILNAFVIIIENNIFSYKFRK